MKQLTIILLWTLFIIAQFSLLSCKKDDSIIEEPPVQVPFEYDLRVLNERFLLPEHEYIISRHWDQYQDLYYLLPDFNRDDYFQFDIKNNWGRVKNNQIIDPYAPFEVKELQISTYSDSTGVYLAWMDTEYLPMNLRLVSYKLEGCSFVVTWHELGVNYFLEYSKLLK